MLLYELSFITNFEKINRTILVLETQYIRSKITSKQTSCFMTSLWQHRKYIISKLGCCNKMCGSLRIPCTEIVVTNPTMMRACLMNNKWIHIALKPSRSYLIYYNKLTFNLSLNKHSWKTNPGRRKQKAITKETIIPTFSLSLIPRNINNETFYERYS